MASEGKEATFAMGDDIPSGAIISAPLAVHYQAALAQVTNPAIDPLRERLVMSLKMELGEGKFIRKAELRQQTKAGVAGTE